MSSATNEKLGAYKTHQRKNEGEREIEARALLTAASSLEEARKPGCDIKFYTEVLQRNQRMWMIFQVALSDPENPLPQELRGLLLTLGRYINRVSFEAITKYQPDMLKSLIDINRRIAAGLSIRPRPKAETQAPLPPPPQPGTPVGITA